MIVKGESLVRPKYASTTGEAEILSIYGVWAGEDYRPSKRRIVYGATAARVQRDSSPVMRVWKHGPTSTEQLEKLAVEDEK